MYYISRFSSTPCVLMKDECIFFFFFALMEKLSYQWTWQVVTTSSSSSLFPFLLSIARIQSDNRRTFLPHELGKKTGVHTSAWEKKVVMYEREKEFSFCCCFFVVVVVFFLSLFPRHRSVGRLWIVFFFFFNNDTKKKRRRFHFYHTTAANFDV